ncbi:hypothetical protein H8D91_01610 [archaeon]|nr:hypothetical protein [archaeon]
MDWVKKQERLQERVFEAIEELADEFDLEVPYYPTVYYIGVGTPKYSEREKSLKEIVDPSYFLYMQRYNESVYLPYDHAIVLSTGLRSHVGEESSHLLHVTNSKIANNLGENEHYKKILIEMIGFFGSKFISPIRLDSLRNVGDIMGFPEDILQETREFSPDTFIYQQAYGLGGRLWVEYENKRFTKEEAREIYTVEKITEKEAEEMFFKLRERFWPLPEKNWIFEELVEENEKPIIEWRIE